MADKGAISFFQRYLTVWVLLCMAAGIALGHFAPSVPRALERLSVAGVSLPIAVLIWLMIFPMMLKIDFASIRQVGRQPKGLFLTWAVNWLVKPFTMFAIAGLFLRVVFSGIIPAGLARDYIAGAVLLGAAPCTAMVFVWSSLADGNPAYTLVQVATNDLIILLAFAPTVRFLLGVGDVSVPYSTLFVSVLLSVVIPLTAGVIVRTLVVRAKGTDFFTSFAKNFDEVTTAGLLLTLVLIFSSQSAVILANPLHILLIAVPLVAQTVLIFALAYGAGCRLRLPHDIAAAPPRRHDWREQLLRAFGRSRAVRRVKPRRARDNGGRADGGAGHARAGVFREQDAVVEAEAIFPALKSLIKLR